MSKKTSSVFISHSSIDKPFVRQLAIALETHGIAVWLDECEMHAGDSLFDYISRGIEKAEYFAIILSNNSNNSKWVRNELKAALNRELEEDRTFVIPILIEDVEAPTFLKEKIYSDFRSKEQFETSLRNLLKVFGIEAAKTGDKGGGGKNVKFYPDNFLPDLRFFVGQGPLLASIRATLETDHRAVMHDISGLGKTFASYKLASDNLSGYEKIFLVRATKEEWLESLARCGESVNPDLANLTEQAAKASGFKQWLEENENWLVIYDNVDLPEELSFYLPTSERGDCVFTSNSNDAAFLGTEISIVKMDAADAAMLLHSRSLGKRLQSPALDGEERSAFNNLIREIDGLPVTLNATGAIIFKRKLNFHRFWEIYRKTPEIAWEGEDPYSTYQHKSAGKIFSLVYNELCGTDTIGDAVKIVLDSMSFISTDEIPEDLLQEILRAQDESFAKMEEPDDLWDEVREKLTECDLLKYDRYTKTFTTHRAIQRVIQSKLKGKEKDICITLASFLRALFPGYDYLNREECEKYYQHVLVLLENVARFGAEIQDTHDLYFAVGLYQRRLGNYALAERFYLRAAEISALASGAENVSLSTNLNELAKVYSAQGRHDEAARKLGEALRITEKARGREHPYYAMYLNNLANVYSCQGKYNEAIEKLEEAQRIAEKTMGKGHPEYAGYLVSLGSTFRSQHRYSEAIEKFEEALHIDEKTHGSEHPYYAIDLHNLALVFQAQGRDSEAIEKYEEALRVDEKTIGCKHPRYAIRLNELADIYKRQGKFQKALELYKNALRIYEKTLPEGHPDIAHLRRSVERCEKKVS